MAVATIAHSAAHTKHRSHKPSARRERGIALFRAHPDGIIRTGPHSYRVRSGSDRLTFYTVITRKGLEFCDCPDFFERCEAEGEFCKHIHAALCFIRCSGECADCKVRLLHRDLYEVGADHLTWFEGDELCGECAFSAGVR